MPGHWTYDSFDPAAELEQGDILQPTDALKRIFSEVHPHFSHDKYLGFLVATQSCDLVRRRAEPKASYVNLAAIRPLSQVIAKILGYVADPVAPRAFRASRKRDARQMLQRLLNQNEQAMGLFFLHTDEAAGIAEAAVAFLRVTVALRSDHYETLREARVGRLTSEFRAKLGWLIGNLYVRPATKDWDDVEGGKKAVDALISQYINEVRWIDDEIVERAREQGVDLEHASDDRLKSLRPPSLMERALEEARAELTRVAPTIPQDVLAKFQNRLRNSGRFKKLFGRANPG
jgi:hypothetical protein